MADEDLKKAWEKLKEKRKEELENAEFLLLGKELKETGETNKEENKKENEESPDSSEEKAAVWLTGGLEEVTSARAEAPVLPMQEIQPVSSLEDISGGSVERNIASKETKKETRPYETESNVYEEAKEEVYEESPENLFSRMVKPLQMRELRQDIPSVAMPMMSEIGTEERREMVKYIESKQESSELAFMQREKIGEIKKYKKRII